MGRKSIIYTIICLLFATYAFAGQNIVGDLNVTKNVTVGQNLVNPTPFVPTQPTDTGKTGQYSWDGDYLYMCTATDTWERVAIATWTSAHVALAIQGVQVQIAGVNLQI